MRSSKDHNSGQPIKVVLADDHHVVRSGIRAELEHCADIEVIGEAVNGVEAVELAQKLLPDVMILDISMPLLRGTEVIERLNEIEMAPSVTATWPPRICVLSAYCEQEYVYSFFAAGAKGYLLKDEPPKRIGIAIRQIMKGEPALSISVQKVLLTRQPKTDHDLSVRELEVLRLLARGNTNEEIAETLVIAIGTVKNHVTNIYKKLPDVRTRSEAVAWAWKNKIVEIA